jgi:hypothetical protein
MALLQTDDTACLTFATPEAFSAGALDFVNRAKLSNLIAAALFSQKAEAGLPTKSLALEEGSLSRERAHEVRSVPVASQNHCRCGWSQDA